MAIPTTEWDESNPPGPQTKSLGAIRKRKVKTQLREIFEIDHNMDSSGSGDTWGYHNKCTFYNRSADSLPAANTGCLFSKDVDSKSELHWVDENDDVIQITSKGEVIAGLTGEVRIWSGAIADIPEGWALCDGVSNPLNLIGKHIRGVNSAITDPGTAGGNDSLTLSSTYAPSHTHDLTDGTHSHYISANNFAGPSPVLSERTGLDEFRDPTYINGGAHTHSLTAVTGVAFDNRPVYLEEAFIIKT